MRLVIAARRSELARIQAYQVGEALHAAHPHLSIEYSFRESLGDRNQSDPLWQMPEKGVFTQDFRAGLLAGEFDLVVHSWKDLAEEEQTETEIGATLPRADPRDLLLVRADRWPEVKETGRMRILTSSPRRSYNLDPFLRRALPAELSQVIFEAVRGNVPTRVRKLWDTPADGLIVAKAAIDRLLETNHYDFWGTREYLRRALRECLWMVLPLRANPTAPAQGALAVEILTRRRDLRELLAPINCAETFSAAGKERAILKSYGGGCHQKIGVSVLQRSFGQITFMRGVADGGRVLDECTLSASRPRPARSDEERMWPLSASETDWFSREPISVSMPAKPNAFWISKADALPATWVIGEDQIVWASGLRTWERLAQRGLWVNGTAESLGEQETPRIETICGGKLEWMKLTHEHGFAGDEMPTLATYRLVPRPADASLRGKNYFFWSSGSSFAHAISREPWLKEMTHFCGPGNTKRVLEGYGIEPFVFLDHAQWLKEMSSR